MITLVVDKEQNKIGYVIDNKFFPTRFIESIVDKPLSVDQTKIGFIFNKVLIISTDVFSLESDFLEQIKGVSLEFNDISFIKRCPSEDELNDLSNYWRSLNLYFRNVYTIIDGKLNILGYFITKEDIYSSSSCYLGMIEILDKGQGIGTAVVSKLRKLTSIRGLSCISAVEFWERNGAKFSESNKFELLQDI